MHYAILHSTKAQWVWILGFGPWAQTHLQTSSNCRRWLLNSAMSQCRIVGVPYGYVRWPLSITHPPITNKHQCPDQCRRHYEGVGGSHSGNRQCRRAHCHNFRFLLRVFLSTSRVCELELRGTCAFVTSGATTLYADAAATYSSQGRSSDALVCFRCLWVSRTFIGWRKLPCYMPSSERLWVIMSMQCSGHFRPSCFRFS